MSQNNIKTEILKLFLEKRKILRIKCKIECEYVCMHFVHSMLLFFFTFQKHTNTNTHGIFSIGWFWCVSCVPCNRTALALARSHRLRRFFNFHSYSIYSAPCMYYVYVNIYLYCIYHYLYITSRLNCNSNRGKC